MDLKCSLIASILAACASVSAQGSGGEDLGLSLSSLLNMKITVASDQAEKISDAPGAVTAYSSEDIAGFGYLTLRELAEITPGYSAHIGGDQKQNWSLETRGGTASLNEKHLVRIDGIPVNHARNNRAFINEELPLLFVQRAEFLRGPASSLYGIGAFNGVLNLVPKSRTENGTSIETRFSLGSEMFRDSLNGFGNYNREGALVLSKNGIVDVLNKTDDQELQASVGFSGKAPDLITYPKRGGPDQNQRKGLFGRVSEKLETGPMGDVTLGVIYMEMEHGYGTSWAGKSQPSNFQRWTTLIPYLKHNIAFNDKTSLESYVKYNESREAGLQSNQEGWWAGKDTTGIFEFDVMTVNWEGFTKLRYDWTEKTSLLAGLNYDVRWQDAPYTFINQSNSPAPYGRLYHEKAYTYSAFAQARSELNVMKGLILTAGVRSDNGVLDGNVYSQLSPRLAAVQKLTDELNVKLMYGTALKAPGQDNISHNREKQVIFDTYNDTNTINQTLKVADLEAEIIRAFEGNLTYASKMFYASGTGFYNIIENQIQRDHFTRADSTNRKLTELSDYWLNTKSEQKSFGVELETQVAVTQSLRIWLNGSYTKTEDEKGDPLAYIPPIKSNLGVTYTTPKGLSAFAVLKMIPSFTSPSASNPDSTVTGFNVIDVHLTQKISNHASAGLSVANLTDSDFEESVSEAYPGRTITVSLSTQF